jgi:hypothetical protein
MAVWIAAAVLRTPARMAGFARHRPNPLFCEKLVGLENGREDYGLFQEDY